MDRSRCGVAAACWMVLCASAGVAFAAEPSTAAAAAWTTAEDHQDMLRQLGITQLRPGRNANEGQPNAANYDEALANPYPDLPKLLRTTKGRDVTTARQWRRERRP
jgi:hypothetical protein